MSTSIEWTDRTLNPGIYGCQAISPACAHCYAAPMARRLEGMGAPGYRDGSNVKGRQWTGKVRVDYSRIKDAFASLPKRKPCRVFVTSMADLFNGDVPFDFVHDVFKQMEARPHLTFQVLTKRPENALVFWEDWREAYYSQDGDTIDPLPDLEWPSNVWIGCTVEDQRRANERIPHLLRIPAAVRFLSVEPMLGPVDLTDLRSQGVSVNCLREMDAGDWCGRGLSDWSQRRVHWVIAGGESGPNARPSHPDWFRSLRDQCVEAEVPFFFKQWGEWIERRKGDKFDSKPTPIYLMRRSGSVVGAGERYDPARGDAALGRVGKKAAGRLLDGRTWDQSPEVLEQGKRGKE